MKQQYPYQYATVTVKNSCGLDPIEMPKKSMKQLKSVPMNVKAAKKDPKAILKSVIDKISKKDALEIVRGRKSLVVYLDVFQGF